ncbi:hypothetical protein [Pontiella agarivorans]|uniref:Uncharacterized protein n=1 Tax=Pontiella agarivorans TaxID=3038953 RepID=A0ABU5MYH3_9BACT|nr:hypothetical protein [Pontiella agarivorans]MDZ8119222.1 hypothetical protein [Pontiella agarivorans]
MIDIQGRLKARSLLEKILGEGISNYDLQDSWPESGDPAISALLDAFDAYYDDFPETQLTRSNFSSDVVQFMERSILFLSLVYEYEWPFFNFTFFPTFLSKLCRSGEKWRLEYEKFKQCGDFDVWPFFRESDYEEALKESRL